MKAGETGRFGENEACRYLTAQGFQILMRNYHSRYGEIDLVAERDDTVVFVEVKTRRDAAFAEAAQAVGSAKQEKLRKTALFWFQEFGERNAPKGRRRDPAFIIIPFFLYCFFILLLIVCWLFVGRLFGCV